MRDEGLVTYTAAMESAATRDTDKAPSAFTQRVLREATRRRFTAADRTVVRGDGAPWIWSIVAIGARLKRAGMPWTIAGANAILALRCCRLSGRFQDFWERRTERQKAA